MHAFVLGVCRNRGNGGVKSLALSRLRLVACGLASHGLASYTCSNCPGLAVTIIAIACVVAWLTKWACCKYHDLVFLSSHCLGGFWDGILPYVCLGYSVSLVSQWFCVLFYF